MISVAIITQSLTFLRNVPRGFDRKEQKDRADTKRYRLYLGALEGIRPACAVLAPCGKAAADLTAKNSPPDCFLNAISPLRVRIPFKGKKVRADTEWYRLLLGALEGIRTPDLLVRSQSLYPAELQAHTLSSERPSIIAHGFGKSKRNLKKIQRERQIIFHR